MRPTCSRLWLEQGQGGIEKLEALLWTVPFLAAADPAFIFYRRHAPRARRIAHYSISIWRARPIDSRPRSKPQKIHGNTINAKMRKLTHSRGSDPDDQAPDWRTVLVTPFQDAFAARERLDGPRSRRTAAHADRRCASSGWMRCWSRLEAAIVQTSLPIVRHSLERHKAATGEFDYDDQIKGVDARARRRAWRRADSGDAKPLSVRLDRRIPGYRRAAMVVLSSECSSRAKAGTWST